MRFLSMSSFHFSSGRLDQADLFYYDGTSRCRWTYVPHVVLVPRPRLTGAAGILRRFPRTQCPTLTCSIFRR